FGVLIVGKGELKVWVMRLRADIEVDDRLYQVASQSRREPTGIGAENIAPDSVMDLRSCPRSGASRHIGSQSLPEHRLTHLPVDVLTKALVEIGAAGLTRFDELDDHRLGDDRCGVGADICHGPQKRTLVGFGRTGAVFADAQRLSVHFGKSYPIFEYVVLE